MPLAVGFGPVPECCAVVEHLVGVEELDIAALELHLEVDRGIVRYLIVRIQRRSLLDHVAPRSVDR